MAQTLPTQQVPRVTQLSHMATLGQPWEADILGPISLRFHREAMSLGLAVSHWPGCHTHQQLLLASGAALAASRC